MLLICGHIRNTHSAATAGTQPWGGGRQRGVVRDQGDVFPALARVLDGELEATPDAVERSA